MTNSIALASETSAAVAGRLRSDIAAGRLEIPALPGVAAEVLSHAVDDQLDAGHLADLVQQDESLVGHVLRVVNSPAFRGATEIAALQQAIARLGTVRIKEIALAASLRGALCRAGPYRARVESTWEISLAAGLWAKEVDRARSGNGELAYLCGLLHNLGAPLLLHRLGELDAGLPAPEVDAIVAATEAEAGVLVAQAWDLPEPVLAVIAHLRTPGEAGAYADLVAVVGCGVGLAHWMCDRSVLLADLLRLPAVGELAMTREDVEQLLEQRDEIRVSMESMVL